MHPITLRACDRARAGDRDHLVRGGVDGECHSRQMRDLNGPEWRPILGGAAAANNENGPP